MERSPSKARINPVHSPCIMNWTEFVKYLDSEEFKQTKYIPEHEEEKEDDMPRRTQNTLTHTHRRVKRKKKRKASCCVQ